MHQPSAPPTKNVTHRRSLILTFRFKAKSVLAVHRAHGVPIQTNMHRGRMHVAPHPLQWFATENSLPT